MFFVNMIVPIVPMIIVMTQAMQNESNKDVWPPFQSSNCTLGCVFDGKKMVNQQMENKILNHQFTCHSMNPKFHNL
jgi:hypothetical protein